MAPGGPLAARVLHGMGPHTACSAKTAQGERSTVSRSPHNGATATVEEFTLSRGGLAPGRKPQVEQHLVYRYLNPLIRWARGLDAGCRPVADAALALSCHLRWCVVKAWLLHARLFLLVSKRVFWAPPQALEANPVFCGACLFVVWPRSADKIPRPAEL